MNRSLSVTVCLALAAAFVACGNEAPASGQDSTTSSDEAVRIKIHPKGGNGLFKLLAPDFDWVDGGTSPFLGTFRINNTPIQPGGTLELAQNAYTLQSDATSAGRNLTSLSQAVSYMFVSYGILSMALFLVNMVVPEASLKKPEPPERASS